LQRSLDARRRVAGVATPLEVRNGEAETYSSQCGRGQSPGIGKQGGYEGKDAGNKEPERNFVSSSHLPLLCVVARLSARQLQRSLGRCLATRRRLLTHRQKVRATSDD
jgi:hypothetical protein